MEIATLAGGCFWCIESAFKKVLGIISTTSGYTGGVSKNPTYEEVCSGTTGHFEAVQVKYDPLLITYLQILDIFWLHIDPFDPSGQFYDKGSQYRTAIFFHNAVQKECAENSKKFIEELFNKAVATLILPAVTFFQAEESHQNYCNKNPAHYQAYQRGHIDHLKNLWDNHAEALRAFDLKNKLTPLQYAVTQEGKTEPPFDNFYCYTKEEGLYVDLITGIPLFASCDKFDSKTGWPSFTKPIQNKEIHEKDDWKLGMLRREILASKSGSHLGHVFPDGPQPTGLRYCLNSAALRFIPKEHLEEEGLADYLYLFDASD